MDGWVPSNNVDIRYRSFRYCIGKNIYFVLLYSQSACLCLVHCKLGLSDLSVSGCARVCEFVCVWVSLVSIADPVFGLSCFSIDILWKNLSCPELLFSSFLCLSVCCCSGWCSPLSCYVCLYVSVLIDFLWGCAFVCVLNKANSITSIVYCLFDDCRWIRSVKETFAGCFDGATTFSGCYEN